MELIPAIDIIAGQCVRLTQGDYQRKTVYDNDPVAVAQRFEAMGCTRLHLVDLDGARSGTLQNIQVLRDIANATSLRIDYSGGIRTGADAETAFAAGAAWVCIGSMAYKQPQTVYDWGTAYGHERFIISADMRDGMLLVNAWQETTDKRITDFISDYFVQGFTQFCCTNVNRDGMMNGIDATVYSNLLDEIPGISLIASGGVSSVADITAAKAAGCTGIITGKAVYEDNTFLQTALKYI